MSGRIPFTKMSGAGNDFVVLDAATFSGIAGDRAAFVRAVCRRGLSVGADGLLVVSPEPPGRVRVVFFNPDGGEAFCGNGSRCAARYAALRRMTDGAAMILATAIGDVSAELSGSDVCLTLPPPRDGGVVTLRAGGTTFEGRRVLAGVPHLVIAVSALSRFPVQEVAPALRRDASLGPAGANVNFVERHASDRVHVRTYERGVEAETLACGTGAVATALAARLDGGPETITVVPRSGVGLTVTIASDHARLCGDARVIFEGELDSEAVAFPS